MPFRAMRNGFSFFQAISLPGNPCNYLPVNIKKPIKSISC